TIRESAPVLDQPRPLAADFTAPIAFYPRTNEWIAGILSMIQVEKYIKESGLFMLQPYDPGRIPVIFLHALAYTPQMWENVLKESCLFMLQPYDPGRIPVIFIHGLASTPQMWVNVINEIEGDPDLRGRCQYWVVSYPSGTPVTYTAMRLREDLVAIEKKYPCPY